MLLRINLAALLYKLFALPRNNTSGDSLGGSYNISHAFFLLKLIVELFIVFASLEVSIEVTRAQNGLLVVCQVFEL
jgi:hypothetical protein